MAPSFNIFCDYNKKLVSIVLFVSVAFVATSCKEDPPDLTLKLEKNQKFSQQAEVISRVIQVYREDSIETLMEVKIQTNYRVVDADEGVFNLLANHQLLEADMVARGRHFGISSEEGKTGSPLSDVLSQMKNMPFTMQLNSQGRVNAINGIRANMDSAMNTLEGYSDIEIDALREQLETSFGEGIFVGNFEIASAVLPDHPVVEGDNWEVFSEMVTGFAGMAKVNYTLSEITADHYTILGSGTIFSDPNGSPAVSSTLQLQYELEGTLESVVKLDRKTGWVIDATIGQKLRGTVAMPSQGADQAELKLPMYLENQLRITGKVK